MGAKLQQLNPIKVKKTLNSCNFSDKLYKKKWGAKSIFENNLIYR